MGAKEKTRFFHEGGFNCAQSVLAALGEYTGLDEKTALSVAAGFGGGVYCGEICGAISGAIMVLGLVFPHTDSEDEQSGEKIKGMTRRFTAECRDSFGALRCAELRGGVRSCGTLIEETAELAEQYILKNRG